MKSEDEEEHERNIDNMIQEDDYNLPWKNKDVTVATTVNNSLDDTGYTFLYSFQTNTSDSSKHVETIKEPIKDDTRIINRVRHLQDGPTNVDPVLT